jgi:hypothetical protein
MSRNRVIYQSEALFVGQDYTSTGATAHEQLRRVQSANYSIAKSELDVNQFGDLARVGALVVESPSVTFDFSYFVTDGFNERAMGFYVETGTGATASGFATSQMLGDSGRNFYITTTDEGTDMNDGAIQATDAVIGIGNGYISDYTVEGAVGSLLTATVSVEALNAASDESANSITSPGVNPSAGTPLGTTVTLPTPSGATGATHIVALRPGDITLDFGGFANSATGVMSALAGASGIHIQSFSLSVPLSRSPLEKLGSKYAYSRVIDFPLNATLSVNAILNEISAKNLSDLLDVTDENDITITINDPAGTKAMVYELKGATVTEESFSSAIGSNKTVDLTFSSQIGGPTDAVHNVLVSGAGTEVLFA